MKRPATRHAATLCALLCAVSCLAQSRHAAAARATANLEELARLPGSRPTTSDSPPREIHEPERAVRRRNSTKPASLAAQPSTAVPFAPASAPPSFSGFLGLADNFTAIPPDTEGAVGPDHVVTMLNTQVTIQSRAGVARANFPISLNAFWSPLGSFTDTFDPRILYDASAGRWIASAAVNGASAASALLLAVSAAGDPAGTWNYYKVDVGASNRWGDFPALGFNATWVVVSMNMFQVRGAEDYIATNLYVFSKADLYGKGTGTHTTFTDTNGELTPAIDCDNAHPEALYLAQAFATGFAPMAGTGAIRISKITGVVGAESFRGGNAGTLNIADPWDDTGPAEADFAPQLGATAKIDTGDSRLDNCVLRNSSIWCAHTVFLPYGIPTRAAAQWFQVDVSGTAPALVQRGRIEDSAGTYFFAYPTIAVNKKDEVLIGFTRFSATDYPTVGIALRTPADPLNTTQPPVAVKAGESPYVNIGARSGSNRWGDYSATLVDPVNDMDFWTLQEYAAAPPAKRNGAFGTWWAHVTAPSAASTCSYTLSPAKASFDSNAATAAVTVSAAAGCMWQAVSNTAWIAITAGSSGNGPGTVQYTVSAAQVGNSARTGSMTIAGRTFVVTQGAPGATGAPAFTAQSVVNAASQQNGAIAPGELLAIYGTNLGPATLATPSADSGTIAGGTRVLFDGIAAPVLYAVSGQAGAIVPFGLQQGATTQVQVEYLGTRSTALSLPVIGAAPGIFTASQSGNGQGSILNQDYSVNSISAPAAIGSVVMIYATGGGAITGPVQNGAIAQPPYATLSQDVAVRIGGVPAQILYQGAAPGLVMGVVQINAVIPAAVTPGGAVPVELTIGGVTSPAGVTMAVR